MLLSMTWHQQHHHHHHHYPRGSIAFWVLFHPWLLFLSVLVNLPNKFSCRGAEYRRTTFPTPVTMKHLPEATASFSRLARMQKRPCWWQLPRPLSWPSCGRDQAVLGPRIRSGKTLRHVRTALLYLKWWTPWFDRRSSPYCKLGSVYGNPSICQPSTSSWKIFIPWEVMAPFRRGGWHIEMHPKVGRGGCHCSCRITGFPHVYAVCAVSCPSCVWGQAVLRLKCGQRPRLPPSSPL